MRKKNELILGIGHKVKSIHNPDKRVSILKEFVLTHFPRTDVLKFALGVEAVTTKKKANLILNVDGCIGKTPPITTTTKTTRNINNTLCRCVLCGSVATLRGIQR